MITVSVPISDLRGLTYEATGARAKFTFPHVDGKPDRSVTVELNGSTLQFFPDRSAGQREVLTALGIAT